MTTAAPTVTTFVIDSALPWPDERSGPIETGPVERATLHRSGGAQPCIVERIAAGGAVISAAAQSGFPGEGVLLELDCGQRRQAVLDWTRPGALGIHFAEPLDIVALLNRSLVAQPAERRRMPRVELRCLVHVKWCGQMEPAMLRNISCSGLQVEGECLPGAGTLVSLFIDGLNLPAAEVVWRQGRLAGFALFEELGWSSLIAWVRSASREAATPG